MAETVVDRKNFGRRIGKKFPGRSEEATYGDDRANTAAEAVSHHMGENKIAC